MKLNFYGFAAGLGSLLLPLTVPAQPSAPSPAPASIIAPFIQEVPTCFAQADGLPSNDLRQIAALADGRIVVADAAGRLAVFQDNHWAALQPLPGFAVRRLCAAGAALWAFGEGRAALLQNSGWLTRPAPPAPEVHAVAVWNGGALVAAGERLWHCTDSDRHELPWTHGRINALAVAGSGWVAAGTDHGLYLAPAGSPAKTPAFRAVYPADARYSWSPRRVRALVAEGQRLWFGAENGAGVFDGSEWKLFTGREGLPWNGFTCAASDGTNTWFGTDRGAVQPGSPPWSYRASRRWLPADAVSAVAVDSRGAWFAGPAGVTRLERRAVTLADKAAHFERLIDERHTRLGYVVRCKLKSPGDLSTAWINHTDNDGLYTAMYGAAECFRYAATRDPDAKHRATRSLAALKLLFEVTGIPGFPARSLVPTTWRPDPNEGFGAAANAAEKARDPLWKNILPRWPKSADGRFWWKCDTSSDEVCGHYFFYAAYHDFVAETPAEKAAVVAVVRALTDHLVDHGYRLVDHDGQPTRWGNWSPEYCHSPAGWADRGIQAVEILSFLNVAFHVTGDAKYRAAAAQLRERHAYHINALDGRAVFPPENVVPWDNNLAFLSYWGLIQYETDPELRAIYRSSLERNWLFVSRHNDPFFNFMFAALSRNAKPSDADGPAADFPRLLARGAQTLRGMPLLLLGWPAANSHRLDVILDPTPGQKAASGWSAVTGEALPVEERSQIRINSDSLSLDGGFGGDVEYEGTYFLLPYYLGLHHGFLK